MSFLEVNEKMNLKELANLEKKSTDDNKEKNAKQLAENKKQILEKLQEILETQYKNKPDTRAMVFVKTRSMAQHLSDYLNRCACIKPFAGEDGLSRYLTSSNQSRKYGGVSSAESEAFIRAFGLGMFFM
jgi:ERCC4-related helicase